MIDTIVPSWEQLQMTGQILLALLLGGVIGFERERRNKPAGLRTHMLVAAGTTAFTLASMYGFGGTPRDPSRVAAQIVSGVGFLGAGTIFRSGSEVRGLTTAATIWLVAALGMLVGTRMYWLAISSTALAWLVLHVVQIGRSGTTVEADEDVTSPQHVDQDA